MSILQGAWSWGQGRRAGLWVMVQGREGRLGLALLSGKVEVSQEPHTASAGPSLRSPGPWVPRVSGQPPKALCTAYWEGHYQPKSLPWTLEQPVGPFGTVA